MKRLILVILLATTLGCPLMKKKQDAGAAPSATVELIEASTDTPELLLARVTKTVGKMDEIAKVKLPAIVTKATLKNTPPKPVFDSTPGKVNTAVMTPEILTTLGALDHQMPAFASLGPSWCAALVHGKKATIDDMYLRQCDQFRYVAVIRFSSRRNPKMTGGATYQGGEGKGDATIFDLTTGQNIGAVPFDGVNASAMQAMQGLEINRAIAELETQCAWDAQTQINAVYGEPPPPRN